MKRTLISLGVWFLSTTLLWAQDNQTTPETTPKPCSNEAFSQFDFWVGEWELTWGESGEGTNSIAKKFDGCIVVENFDGGESIPLRGMSVSTFSLKTGKWHQTWVDNQGGYLDFEGGFADDRMILSRQTEVEDRQIWQRMVWYNIHSDSLDWNWERSNDGENWDLVWKIHYKRIS